MLNRLRSAARYFDQAAPVWKWKLSRGKCPFCAGGTFLSLAPNPFMTRCLSCRNTVVNLAVVATIQERFAGAESAYELSSYGATFEYQRRNSPKFQFSEYFPGRPLGELVDGVRNEDVQNLTFPDDSFDLVTSTVVFEHVVDDLAGFRECLRVLKPGGALVFTIPLHSKAETFRLASLDAEGKIAWHGAPEFHDSRLGGPGSAPTFWHHAEADVCDRVKRVGFSKVDFSDVQLAPAQTVPQKVICALK